MLKKPQKKMAFLMRLAHLKIEWQEKHLEENLIQIVVTQAIKELLLQIWKKN